MKEKQTIVYSCDHCKKKYFKKHAALYHEKYCPAAPENQKACSMCKFIEPAEIEIPIEAEYYSGKRMASGYRCTKLNKLLYPIKVEFKKLPQRFPETFENQEPMPHECEHMQIEGLEYFK